MKHNKRSQQIGSQGISKLTWLGGGEEDALGIMQKLKFDPTDKPKYFVENETHIFLKYLRYQRIIKLRLID